MDALGRDLEQDGLLSAELQRHGVLGCSDVDLDITTVRCWIDRLAMAHGVTDGVCQRMGEEEVVHALSMDAPIVGYLFT